MNLLYTNKREFETLLKKCSEQELASWWNTYPRKGYQRTYAVWRKPEEGIEYVELCADGKTK